MNLPIRNSRLRLPQGQLFWREVGQGTTVLFLHDAWSDGEEWRPIIEQLGGDIHALAPDLLGFGESDRPKVAYSIALEREVLSQYLAALRQKRVILVGHGLGGWLAASYALHHPEQVHRLVLVTPEGLEVTGVADPYWSDRWLLNVPLLGPLIRLLLPVARLLHRPQVLQRWLQRHTQLRRSPASCRLLFRRRRRELQAERLNAHLNNLTCPTLVLHGSQDSPGAIARSRAYSQAPNATVMDLPGANLLLTTPDRVVEAIRQVVAGDRVRG